MVFVWFSIGFPWFSLVFLVFRSFPWFSLVSLVFLGFLGFPWFSFVLVEVGVDVLKFTFPLTLQGRAQVPVDVPDQGRPGRG